MPVPRYGLLKGHILERRIGTDADPHYHLLVAATIPYRVSVNVQSQAMPSTLDYLIDPDFRHPLCDRLAELPRGFTAIAGRRPDLALDYLRAGLFEPGAMRPLPFDVPGPDNDLNEALDTYIVGAIADPAASVYAFGSRWGPEWRRDAVFGFRPTNGMHNVHMNQRNSAGFASQEGAWHDGALLLQLAADARWVAIFLKFGSQSLAAGAAPIDASPPAFGPTGYLHRYRRLGPRRR